MCVCVFLWQQIMPPCRCHRQIDTILEFLVVLMPRLFVESGCHCLFNQPFLSVCLSMQLGVSNPRSGPHRRRDAADWSQCFFSALPRIWLHHHTARWHVRESFCIYWHCISPLKVSSQVHTSHWFLCGMNCCHNGRKAAKAILKGDGHPRTFPPWNETLARCTVEQYLMQMSQW